ncbi:B3 domain-containing transcription factor VRN1-like isoform X2 [Actinidia eriantha]|uniref:B3 domain-containing transcription factor VRN1-like isoform X2 n=1 Tax=Actinidia eriantha TaxID=165200 RepID=UPI002585DE66|nr:B3 domain-containing transcription factor VRN1-like isoform X2 [Actinidia eriantha]
MGLQGDVADTDRRRPSIPAKESSIFYRLIVSSIIHDRKLIPGKFTKKLGNELPAIATLTTPNGCVWQVGLKEIDGKVWFTNGWHEFVERQSIHVGYLLIFTYEGNLSFRVNIYNMATAEIKYQGNALTSNEGPNCNSRCPVFYRGEAENNDLVDIFDSISHPPWQTLASRENKVLDGTLDDRKASKSYDPRLLQNLEKAPVAYAQYAGYSFNGTEITNSKYKSHVGNSHLDIARSAARSTRDIGIQCTSSELMKFEYEFRLHSLNQRPDLTRKRKRGVGPHEHESSAAHGSEVQSPRSETSCRGFFRRSRVVTPEEKEKVLSESKMFQSENPFCRVILRRSYVYKGIGLHMPASFAEKYLSGIQGFITLQVSNGEKWPVRCMWRDGSAKLSKGWPEFVLENRLEEGDVCIFELIRVEEIVLNVTIFRAVEDGGPVNQLPMEHLGRTGQLTFD